MQHAHLLSMIMSVTVHKTPGERTARISQTFVRVKHIEQCAMQMIQLRFVGIPTRTLRASAVMDGQENIATSVRS